MSSGEAITRRQALVVAAGAATTAALPEGALAQTTKAVVAPTSGKFLTARELAVLDEVAELIIPADAQSGGARAAKCAQYIDARLAESIDPDWRQSWKDDLAEIDEVSVAMFGRPLLQASPAERQKLMERISRNEKNPRENVEHSFVTIKWWVAEAYYTSNIGIHDELKYEGNVYIDEFIGTDISASPGGQKK
jgi:glucoside 3-dehydrogenase (cytochrome c) hitch-hiker subunit